MLSSVNPHITPSKRKEMPPKDYHKSFDNENFLHWFMNDMIPAAERAFPGKRLTIIMDNASYHKYSTFVVHETVGEGPATITRVKRDSRKELLVKFIQEHRGADAASISMLKVALVAQFDEIVAEMGCDAERFCRNRQPVAHEILFTPPRYSEWQPIELFWAAVKNEVASKWQSGRGMTLAETQTIEALEHWGSPDHLIGKGISFCGKLWRKCIGLIRTYLADLRESDEQPQQHEHPEHVADDDVDSTGSGASSCDDDRQSDFSSED